MGRETKIGLTVLGLLLGVFGLVVYFKVFRTAPGPSAEAVASALEKAEAAAAGSEAEMLAGGPKVQLSPGAAEQAPVEFADTQVAAEADAMSADEPVVAQQGEPADWSAPPAASRYADPVEADENDPAAPAEAVAGDEPPLGNEPVEDAYVSEPSTSLEEPAQVAAQPNSATESQVAGQPEDDWSREPAVIEPAEIEPAEGVTVRGVVPQEAVTPQETVQGEPAADPRLREPVQFAPSSVTSVPGETIQAGAEEVVAEPPATVEDPVSSRGGRYGRAAAPAYQAQEAEAPPEQAVEAPPSSSRQSAPPQGNFNARAAAPATLPTENNFARPDQNYTIEPNDNYWRISQKLYGTGAYFKALFEHNRQKFPRADRLRQGDVISAPPIDVLEKTYPDLCPRPQQRAAEPKTMRAVSNRRPPSSGKVYIVEEGDTLFDIAKYELGQASRWGELYELNRDVLGDQGDRLKPGMELRLPSTTQRESVATEPRNPVR